MSDCCNSWCMCPALKVALRGGPTFLNNRTQPSLDLTKYFKDPPPPIRKYFCNYTAYVFLFLSSCVKKESFLHDKSHTWLIPSLGFLLLGVRVPGGGGEWLLQRDALLQQGTQVVPVKRRHFESSLFNNEKKFSAGRCTILPTTRSPGPLLSGLWGKFNYL